MGKCIGARLGRLGRGDIGEVTSANSFLELLGGEKRGSAQRATGQGPLRPTQVKANFSRVGEKVRM